LRDPRRLLPDLTPDESAMLDASVATSRLKGSHNLDNARLAAQIALAAGASIEGIASGVAAFHPLPHRLEEHRFGGVVFVNDSISTTPEATKAALAAYKGPRLALLAGGHERQQDYAELASLLPGYGVTLLICLPVTGARLAEATRQVGPGIVVLDEPDLQSAMQRLFSHRDAFDAVILSPGAPSYNQFKNFEERGRQFVTLAETIFGSDPA
ncbi:MAG TPA: cyanophycin synthetase, partial [Devosia sp.]|nr:cyanophycin synthetase [Devosia sp.]